MGLLNLAAYKPAPATPGDANQIANGFTAIEAVVNAITQSNMGAGNKVTASAMSGGPPASPADGDIWIALAVDANGTVWQFRYNAGSASAYKWEFVGGSGSFAVLGGVTLAVVGTYYSPAGPPTFARAGEYMAKAMALVAFGATNSHIVYFGVKGGSAGETNLHAQQQCEVGRNGTYATMHIEDKVTVTAGQGIYLSAYSDSITGAADSIYYSSVLVVPVRVS